MRRGSGGAQAQRGFTYFAVIIAVMTIGIALAVVGVVTRTEVQRQREVQLLFVGHEFRRAVTHYVALNGGHFPQSLDELVSDAHAVKTIHHLRRLYLDPLTRTTDWGLLRLPDGGIYGIYSASTAVPLKRTGFEFLDSAFEDAPCYRAWRFTYVARGSRTLIDPGPVDCATPRAP